MKAPPKKTTVRRAAPVAAKPAIDNVVTVRAKTRGTATTAKGKAMVAAKLPRVTPKQVTPTSKKTKRKKSA